MTIVTISENTNQINIQQCERCILDKRDDPGIEFDHEGICNHCRSYEKLAEKFVFDGEEAAGKLDSIVNRIKASGKNKPYDSIMGVSGGVDSTYLAYLVKQQGLRPLVVHFDNGWNSELAVNNIENIVNRLEFDLYTYVVNWEEFRDLQLSYFKASVLDLEIPTDHGFFAVLYDIAAKKGIKYILSGHNVVTEGILPNAMRWHKLDLLNIKSIQKTFGTRKLKTFPKLGFWKNLYYYLSRKYETVHLLNYVEYDKADVKKFIQKELGWRDYGGKHYESIFTRFYQGYILPTKFGIDKRKAHLATLINSGQITKQEALLELEKPIYDPDQFVKDREFFIKKLGLTEEEFERIMNQPERSHLEFDSYVKKHYYYYNIFLEKTAGIRKVLRPYYRGKEL